MQCEHIHISFYQDDVSRLGSLCKIQAEQVPGFIEHQGLGTV